MEDEACLECPYVAAGEVGNFALKLFRLSCSKQTDKNKISRWYFDPDRMMFGYVTYDVTDKEAAFKYVSMMLQVMNGESEVFDDEMDELG